jgi:hypothetical protein
VTLRQQHIDQPKRDRGGVDRQAGQCALRDESRVVIEREERIGRSRRDRQGRDQRTDRRA